ncbi:MAG: hypothetical protein D3923_19820, partial [Candidatus Electrothrix sp. AR3]|nr:hypothetical protein [Candidatus Electrothrix sp. AR3]
DHDILGFEGLGTESCCGPTNIAIPGSLIVIRNNEVNRDDAQFKMRNVTDIGAVAQALTADDEVTFQFGPCDDPIYSLTVPDGQLNVTYLNMRYTVGNLDVIRCVFSSEQCVVNIENLTLRDMMNNDGDTLDTLLTGTMNVCLKVGDTTYTNTGHWTQYESGSGSWTKYRKD